MLRAVLFDADGVVQRPGERFHQFIARNAPNGDKAAFWKVVGTAEKPCLTGSADFRVALQGALRMIGSSADVDEALEAWNDVVLDSGVLDAIREVRGNGVLCALATNQNPYRANHMRNALLLDGHFDRVFYSCDVGFAKPGVAYFRALVRSLELDTSDCLFIDDSEVNVDSARSVGLWAEHVPPYSGSDEVWRALARHKIFRNSNSRST